MKMLVIVVTYNGLKWMPKCLGSILSSSVKADAVVIDNASADGTAAYVRESHPWVRLVENKENLGFGAANNIGLQMAMDEEYDYAYLLNQDAWLLPDTLSTLVEAAEADGSFAVLSPMQMQADLVHEDILFSRIGRRGGEGVEVVSRVMAAHWLLRVSALYVAGLFAPFFRHYGEDDNLCARFRRYGYRIGIVTAAKAVHDRAGRDLTSKEARQRTWRISALVMLCDPNRPLWIQWIRSGALTLVKTVKNRSLSPLRAFPELIAMNKDIKETRKL